MSLRDFSSLIGPVLCGPKNHPRAPAPVRINIVLTPSVSTVHGSGTRRFDGESGMDHIVVVCHPFSAIYRSGTRTFDGENETGYTEHAQGLSNALNLKVSRKSATTLQFRYNFVVHFSILEIFDDLAAVVRPYHFISTMFIIIEVLYLVVSTS